MNPFIKVEHVDFRYHEEEEEEGFSALKNIDLQIVEGEFVALLGHNGCGKSTLAKHFNGLLLPSAGKVFVDSIDTADHDKKYAIRSKVGLVLQNPDNQIIAGIVEEDIAFGPENLGLPSPVIKERVERALKAVDMYQYRKNSPEKLSGGQKQRVAIAGIIAMEPKCIVLDEPTAMLDPRGREEVLETIQKLNREKGITIILITHYMEEAVLADRVVVMDQGSILIEGPPREVFSETDLLKKHHLMLPQPTEFAEKLIKRGCHLPKGILNSCECTQALLELLEGNDGNH